MAKKDKSTITVNDVEYDVNDFTDEQSALLNHVQDLDRKLSNAQFNLDQLMVGREAFVARLAASLEAKSEDIAAE
jgi:hypothetical protein